MASLIRVGSLALALGFLLFAADSAWAAYPYPPPPGYPGGYPQNPYQPQQPIIPGNTSSTANVIGGGGVTRATSYLANPIGFHQWGQTTGVGPIRGTVRIYNVFGTYMFEGGGSSGGQGGSLQGGNFLGTNTGSGGFGTNIPGSGASNGDDAPSGVLLHVNYAHMFFPNQTNINQSNNIGVGGGGGGGIPGGFGYGYPGGGFSPYGQNGGSGL